MPVAGTKLGPSAFGRGPISEGHLAQVRRALDANAVFGVLEPAYLDALVTYGTTARYDAGATIFHKEDAGDSMMVVISGRVKISNYLADGKEAILNFIEPGEVFGEIALLDGRPRSADAAATDPCELFVLRRRELAPFLSAHPEVTVQLIEVLCERLRRATTMVEEIMFLNTAPRIAKALLRLAEEHGKRRKGGVSLEMKISQRDLGGHVGLSRESVNRQLQAWRKAGLVTVENGLIMILQPQRLEMLAEG